MTRQGQEALWFFGIAGLLLVGLVIMGAGSVRQQVRHRIPLADYYPVYQI